MAAGGDKRRYPFPIGVRMDKMTVGGIASYLLGIWLMKHLSLDGLNLYLAAGLLFVVLADYLETRKKRSEQPPDRSAS